MEGKASIDRNEKKTNGWPDFRSRNISLVEHLEVDVVAFRVRIGTRFEDARGGVRTVKSCLNVSE